MTTTLVPDDVWQALDPSAGALDRRTRRRLRSAVVATVAVVVGGGVVAASGVVRPAVTANLSGGYSTLPTQRVFTYTVDVSNSGWTTVTLDGVGRSGPGLRLTKVDTAFPVSLPPSTGIVLTLTYHVDDCAAVPQGRWPVPVRVRRPWGVVTRWSAQGRQLPIGITTPRTPFDPSPYESEWQAALAQAACAPVPPDGSAPE